MVPSNDDPIAAWRSIVGLVHASLAEGGEQELDRRADAESLTLRETVHHVVEANVVAASIVIAALGSPACVYDWSWLQPFGPWLLRMRHGERELGPSLTLLGALNDYVAALVEPLPDGLARTVRLRDAPDAPLRTTTVADVLRAEVEHARGHFARDLPP